MALSDDEGQTWKWKRYLDKAKPREGQSSYPSLMQASDSLLHTTYSFQDTEPGKSIKHMKFNKEWVMAGDK